jgi:glycine/D-amino acid oxidase-like deaminating enzyme
LAEANCGGSGCYYTTVMLTPDIFLSWLRGRCEDAGVRFVRAEVASLRDAAALAPCDVIVNASAHGARTLADVQDAACIPVRGQLMLFRTPCADIHIRYGSDWTDYTYVLPRGDGTAIMGGTKGFHDIDPNVRPEEAADIHRRNRRMLPKYVPPTLEEIDLVKHQVGIRPEREGGPRVEAEVLPSGLRVVHTYGLTGGGYLYSFGMAKEVKKLADGFASTATARL